MEFQVDVNVPEAVDAKNIVFVLLVLLGIWTTTTRFR